MFQTVNPLVELRILAGRISVAVIHTNEPYPMLNMKMYTLLVEMMVMEMMTNTMAVIMGSSPRP